MPEPEWLVQVADDFLRRGLALKKRVDQAAPTQSFEHVFPLMRQFNPANSAYGFFDTATIGGEPFPIIGNYQSMFFDRAQASGETRQREQLREFVLRYFMRVSDFRLPEPWAERNGKEHGAWPSALSLCPEPRPQLEGFGFSQILAKRKGSGEIERFPEQSRHAIIDLREVGTRYEWIVTKVRIFDFTVRASLSPKGPDIAIPLQEESYLVTSPEFITDDPAGGRFGLGYAFIQSPPDSVLAWGPGQFRAAYEQIDFQCNSDGTIESQMFFAADRPAKVASVKLDPFSWAAGALRIATGGLAGRVLDPLENAYRSLPIPWPTIDPAYGFVDLANLATLGMAGKLACISREQLYVRFLVQHFDQHFQTVSGALTTWRRVPDWTDESALPEWVRTGVSS